jgi:two-component system NtrC family sensor kinase
MVSSRNFFSMTPLSFMRELSQRSELTHTTSLLKSASGQTMKAALSSNGCTRQVNLLGQFTSARREGYDGADTFGLRKKRMKLSVKVSLVLILIVGIAAASVEFFDRHYTKSFIQGNYLQEIMSVVRQVGAEMTAPADLHDRTARELEVSRLRANRPDLLDVALYALPEDKGGQPFLVVNAGITAPVSLETAPLLVKQVLLSNQSISDVRGWETTHRINVASPITIDGRLVGATYAEFSTSLFDDLQKSQRRLEVTRILVKGVVIVLAINLFLYFRVHRPVRALLSAVEAVARGKQLTSVPVSGRDEIGQLAERFNVMVERIRAATEENTQLYEKLRLAHDFLQVRVEEATAELRQKNRELARTNDLLSTSQREAARAQRLSAIGQLAATLAHQMGTPLTAVSGHLQLLEEDPQLGPEARKRLKIVETQIERQSRIIQDLLIYARKPDPVFLPMNLNACMEECLALLRPEIDRRHVELRLLLDPSLPKADADPQQLHEVFCNLIENAMDAMTEGGTLTVQSQVVEAPPTETNGWLAVDVVDTGHGIALENREQIFQPFFTTKKSGRGTGLGLAIAFDTVRSHGGQLLVDSEPGKGTRFRVLLRGSEGVC